MRAKTVWRAFGLGLAAGGAYALWRAIEANRRTTAVERASRPLPFPPRPRGEERPDDETVPAWVEPDGGGCPSSHPVKVKLRSGIYHQPGGLSYDRTRPDRCYRDAGAARADGLRAAKR